MGTGPKNSPAQWGGAGPEGMNTATKGARSPEHQMEVLPKDLDTMVLREP